MLENILWWGLTAFYLLGWLLYFRKDRMYRDALTDLYCVMNDHDIESEELRRTEDHKKVKKHFDR